MITLISGDVHDTNSIVSVDGDQYDSFVERDAEGHLTVTVDGPQFDGGEKIIFINSKENNSTYTGVLEIRGDSAVLIC